MLATKPPTERFVFKRNPYYYRVDAQGLQLPYIDRVSFQVADGKLIPAKAAAGEADLRGALSALRQLHAAEGEREARQLQGAAVEDGVGIAGGALSQSQRQTIPIWRELFRDVRFRRALSLAIDRSEINQVIYLGLGVEGGQHRAAAEPAVRRRI